jgi:hypothetical protein
VLGGFSDGLNNVLALGPGHHLKIHDYDMASGWALVHGAQGEGSRGEAIDRNRFSARSARRS